MNRRVGTTRSSTSDSCHVAPASVDRREHEREAPGVRRAAGSAVGALEVEAIVAARRGTGRRARRRARRPATAPARAGAAGRSRVTGVLQLRPPSSERAHRMRLPVPVNRSSPTVDGCSQVRYSRSGRAGIRGQPDLERERAADAPRLGERAPAVRRADDPDGVWPVAGAAQRHVGHVQRAVGRERDVGREALRLLAARDRDRRASTSCAPRSSEYVQPARVGRRVDAVDDREVRGPPGVLGERRRVVGVDVRPDRARPR